MRPTGPGLRRALRSGKLLIGGAVVAVLLGAATVGPSLAPADWAELDRVGGAHQGPSWKHPLGTDATQRDVLLGVIAGSRLSLAAGLISMTLALAVGVPVGVWAGFRGGWFDAAAMRSIDIFLALPSVLIAMLMVMALSPGWGPVVVSVALINVPLFARQIRATVLTIRHQDYVLASRALGSTDLGIMVRVLLPATVQPIIVLATLGLGNAILEVAALSFLGFGGDADSPEWGAMLARARGHLALTRWPAIGPGLAISLTVLGLNLLGDGLRDWLDPQSRRDALGR